MARNQLTNALRQFALSCARIELNRQTLFTKLQGVNTATEVPFFGSNVSSVFHLLSGLHHFCYCQI